MSRGFRSANAPCRLQTRLRSLSHLSPFDQAGLKRSGVLSPEAHRGDFQTRGDAGNDLKWTLAGEELAVFES